MSAEKRFEVLICLARAYSASFVRKPFMAVTHAKDVLLCFCGALVQALVTVMNAPPKNVRNFLV